MGFPGGSDGKVAACNVGDLGSIPGLGRSPGEGNGNLKHQMMLFSSTCVIPIRYRELKYIFSIFLP